MNVELLLKVKKAILADPSRYDQENICASKCCIAGHGQLPMSAVMKQGKPLP